jgi:hypothetical protein
MRFHDVGSQSKEFFYFWDYSHVDVPRPREDVDEFDWTPIYTTPSLDKQVDFFNGAERGFFTIANWDQKASATSIQKNSKSHLNSSKKPLF